MSTAAWEPLKTFATDGSKLLELKSPETWTDLLTALSSQFENDPALKHSAHELVRLTAQTTIGTCDSELKGEAGKVSGVHETVLVRLIENFSKTLKEDEAVIKVKASGLLFNDY